MCDGANLSDHHPLCAKLHWASSPSLFLHAALVNLSSNGLAWYKATDEQVHAYKSLVMDSCHQLPWKEQLTSSVHCVDCKSRTA